MDVAMLLNMASQAAGDRVAVSCGDQHLTYSELQTRAARYATMIRKEGMSSVAFVGENSPEAVALFFGCSIAGSSYVPVNYRWTDSQLAEALSRIAPVGIVTDERSAARVTGLEGVLPLSDPDDADPTEYAGSDGDSPAVMLFTSGTSGTPKAVVLRNRNLVPYVLSTVDFLNAGSEEAILVSVPPYHIAAVSSVLTSIYAGRRMVLMPAFDPDEWVAVARRESVSQAMVVPTMLNRILDVAERDGKGLPTLKHLSYGGGRMPVPTIERAITLLPGLDLVNAYGLTETSSTITLLSPQDHRDAVASADPAIRARLGSVGRALPTVEIEIRDDQGRSVPPGQAGEVWVRGDQVSGEYLSHTATESGGWYPTRDHGHLDEGGFLFLHGRADDVIVRGGENIAPAEVEERLLAHPAVAEVAVVGVPDTEWGERIEAFVVPSDVAALDESELQEWVRAGLRSTRVPAAIHRRDELPYNETGKLLRRQLKAERATELAQKAPR
ncbi:class I adenylate-forming enzyme family protein [Williamsia sp. D3]|uniref:class I adenylate-forming enzyme family protein n=1 Tax=Williamsia sp. D3 TaxID=1313067 RepID=UPI0003D2B014|nr:class I adenylate-forming enzyme family protein [Williamsia sp. D3]ETD33303.1 AMP-dependent synthetase and ligase [Williamsia sp. D3]